MIFTNLNIFSVFIFLILLLLSIFFCYLIFKKTEKNLILSDKIKKNKRIGLMMLFLSFFFIIINIFGVKGNIKEGEEKIGSNILFMLDVSKSMNVQDTTSFGQDISRLELSKNFISNFIENNPENNYGLSIFAGESLRILPFTKDSGIFNTILGGVNEDNLSKFGSNFEIAVKDGISSFKQNDKKGYIVIISDIGEDSDFSNIPDLIKDIRFFVVGVGTEKGGYIPIGKDFIGNIRYKIYESRRVVSSLIVENLNVLSNKLDSGNFVLNKYKDFEKLNSKIKLELKENGRNEYLERRYDYMRIFIGLSFLLFLISIFYLGRKK